MNIVPSQVMSTAGFDLQKFYNQKVQQESNYIALDNMQNHINPENLLTQAVDPCKNILTKYKDIYIPSIYLMDYSKNTEEYAKDNLDTATLSKYFNYNFNFEKWSEFCRKIRLKFDDLNNKVKDGSIILPENPLDNKLEYLMNFPSDYGGLGKLFDEQKYNNLFLFDKKIKYAQYEDKNFMEIMEIQAYSDPTFPIDKINPYKRNNKAMQKLAVYPGMKYPIYPNYYYYYYYKNPNMVNMNLQSANKSGDKKNKK